MKDVAAMVRRHLEGIVAWAQTRQTNGFLEALWRPVPGRQAPRARLLQLRDDQDRHLPDRRQARLRRRQPACQVTHSKFNRAEKALHRQRLRRPVRVCHREDPRPCRGGAFAIQAIAPRAPGPRRPTASVARSRAQGLRPCSPSAGLSSELMPGTSVLADSRCTTTARTGPRSLRVWLAEARMLATRRLVT